MSYIEHANREFRAAGWLDEDGNPSDEMQGLVMDNIRELLEVFAKQGHSGSSAPYVLNLFKRLVMSKPIAPLTGEDSEWVHVYNDDDGDPVYQNNRCGVVFKEKGRAYNMEGRVFREPSGACFTSLGSRVYINFPYVIPERPEYVDVPADGGVS